MKGVWSTKVAKRREGREGLSQSNRIRARWMWAERAWLEAQSCEVVIRRALALHPHGAKRAVGLNLFVTFTPLRDLRAPDPFTHRVIANRSDALEIGGSSNH